MARGGSLIAEAREAQVRAVTWLLRHLDDSGTPADSELRTGWSRLGWSLAIAGEHAAAGAAVDWAARHRIGADGNYLPGYQQGQGYISQYANYWLGTFVVSACLAGRQEVAMRSMDYLRRQQDPVTGGLPVRSGLGNHPLGLCDVLSTAQVGLAALHTGQFEVADLAYRWLGTLMDLQNPQGSVFCMIRRGDALWSEPETAMAWSTLVDFSKSRQAFYGPGMAAVFLAPYAHLRGRPEATALARQFLRYNVEGMTDQFDDLESVQACKFGWAVGVMYQADHDGGWDAWLAKMARWFIDRQSPEGSWGPSRFADADPSIADRMVKTSEHLMELAALSAALGAMQVA